MTDFTTLGLDPRLVETLTGLGFTAPTPIQAEAIPSVLAGRDLMGLAQTGTGKTLAFGLPLVQALSGGKRPAPKGVRSLILAPTRELVNQIAAALTDLTRNTPLKVQIVVGGAGLNGQAMRLARGTDILVATPGRLIDLLERRAVSLAEARYLVLDEADQMLDMGFIQALRRIAKHLPDARQTMLFSATMPREMEELSATYLTRPVRVQVAAPGRPVERIDQGVHFVNQGDKAKLLEHYLGQHAGEAALVFCRTKHGAEKLMKLLDSWGFAAGSIHGNKSQGQRERALASFRGGQIKVLVATDVAARGLDIPLVRHVYNYDLPNVPANYVHRIGRTARAGADGRAVAFCAPAEMGELRAIEKAMGQPIPPIGGTPSAEVAPTGRRPGRGPSPKPANRAPRSGAQGGAGQQPAAKPAAARRSRPRRRTAAA
ncbi:DEAD/DEAH box helicase [Rhodobaculum claviforme]|uniref:DEAD/DEAH box helicase n=1 Tax=Rhodobaculum claviforme TaxID=1549854 RepID=A0A934WJW5_9RHOB|nr:DEAD/DEAH box helicase [Rhodobaculum claviforme]MBK5928471.1 DEAD/DEAH box helicase [Rhodobaculum claviforme]